MRRVCRCHRRPLVELKPFCDPHNSPLGCPVTLRAQQTWLVQDRSGRIVGAADFTAGGVIWLSRPVAYGLRLAELLHEDAVAEIGRWTGRLRRLAVQKRLGTARVVALVRSLEAA